MLSKSTLAFWFMLIGSLILILFTIFSGILIVNAVNTPYQGTPEPGTNLVGLLLYLLIPLFFIFLIALILLISALNMRAKEKKTVNMWSKISLMFTIFLLLSCFAITFILFILQADIFNILISPLYLGTILCLIGGIYGFLNSKSVER